MLDGTEWRASFLSPLQIVSRCCGNDTGDTDIMMYASGRCVLFIVRKGVAVKKSVVVVAAIAAFGFVSSASAADMSTKAPIVKALVAVPYNWTGLYIGGVVGYGWAKAIHCDASPIEVCIPVTDMKGWNAGVTLGYNWQWANWVLGVEGDWSWANM